MVWDVINIEIMKEQTNVIDASSASQTSLTPALADMGAEMPVLYFHSQSL